VAIEGFWAGKEEVVLAVVETWVWLWLLQGGVALQSHVGAEVASVSMGYSIGSSNLSWGLCGFVMRLDERARLSNLRSQRALCVHRCG